MLDNVIGGWSLGVNIEQANWHGRLGQLSGTNATGTAAIPNNIGISIAGQANGTVVGGVLVTERNVISGNSVGVLIQNTGTTGNTVLGNYIGTSAFGNAAIGNATGVLIQDSASNNTIGGSTLNAQNRVAFNATGVKMIGNTFFNRIRRNLVYSNDQLGIDLGGDGVTPNDPNDVDTGREWTSKLPRPFNARCRHQRLACRATE